MGLPDGISKRGYFMSLEAKITPDECRELHEIKLCPDSEGYEAYKCICGIQIFTSDDGADHLDMNNPDFSDPRVVLREMRQREDYCLFLRSLYIDVETIEEMLDSVNIANHVRSLAEKITTLPAD
jgi:hypothetical protein